MFGSHGDFYQIPIPNVITRHHCALDVCKYHEKPQVCHVVPLAKDICSLPEDIPLFLSYLCFSSSLSPFLAF